MYALIIILIIIFILVVWYISIANKITKASIKVEEAFSDIDVALTKRYDLLTRMTEVVKGYAKHEKEIMLATVKLHDNMSIKEMSEANNTMDNNHIKLNAIVENYPKLKADENFKLLQKTILDVEEHLQAARRVYNANVSYYNQLISTCPNNIIASNKKSKAFFEANDNIKENIKIDLN